MRDPISFRLVTAALGLALAGRASAQASRTWVSGVGTDANPCSRTAPCLTFAGALAKTAAGGEIDVLDPADFGAVSIGKSITLDGRTSLGGALQSGASAIVVNAPGSVVVLRNLDIRGGSSAPSGISFVAGGELHLERCTVSGFAQGIDFEPALGGRLFASDLEASDNGDAGVLLSSGDAAHPVVAALSHVHLAGNGIGLMVNDNARASVHDSVMAGNGTAGIAATPVGVGAAEVNLEGVALAGNLLGVKAAAPLGSATVRLSKVVSLDDGTSTQVGANARLLSFGNNRVLGNVPGLCPISQALAPGSLPAGAIGVDYSITFALQNSLGPAAFFLTGALPPGLTFSEGTISGTPTAAGNFPVTVQVQDANGCAVSRDYVLAVAAAPAAPDFAVAVTPASPQVRAGQRASLTVTVTPVGAFTGSVTLSCENLPAHVACSFDSATVSPAGGGASATLALSTSSTAAAASLGLPPGAPGPGPGTAAALGACALSTRAAWATRRRRHSPRGARSPWRSAVLLGLGLLAACHSDRVPSAAAAPGTYIIQVVGTSTGGGATTHSAPVTLSVTP
jgi:Putative Ig domain